VLRYLLHDRGTVNRRPAGCNDCCGSAAGRHYLPALLDGIDRSAGAAARNACFFYLLRQDRWSVGLAGAGQVLVGICTPARKQHPVMHGDPDGDSAAMPVIPPG